MAILKLDKYDEEKEIGFELDYLTSLLTSQRFEMMFRKTEEMLNLLSSPLVRLGTPSGGAPRAATGKRNAHRAVTEIIKREPG